MDQQEFLNAYIQRMLALNSELTNKNVMLETRYMMLEKKHNELTEVYTQLVATHQKLIEDTTPEQEETADTSTVKQEDEQF